ncbi:hypothetical protein HSB1_05010 [Halogranum salarium B-1]|uniref:Uncharacterized protein n=1 Tax=Halogranum salarium B-1 TaxID=1210908 RepID=J2ZL44_9EURY|nr:hypothetical protein HSB1_05010 [Halogranum salarium B-1]
MCLVELDVLGVLDVTAINRPQAFPDFTDDWNQWAPSVPSSSS